MNILGVDQSLAMTGLASFEGAIVLDRIATDTTPAGDLMAMKQRIRYIVGRTLRFAPRQCLSLIESPYIPKHGAGSVLERAWLFGFLVDQLSLRGPVVQVRPKVRAKYAADNGNADKPEVLAAMRARFPQLVIRDDNEADALALLCMGARFLRTPIDGVASKKQEQAMTSTVWPQLNGESK